MPQPKCIALLLACLLVLLPRAACAQAKLKIFDAHLHYNQEPNPFYPLEKVLEVFRRNDVGGIIANSRPNKGTHDLVTAKAQGLLVVPFIRPYRTRADVTDWSTDPSIYALIESEYQRGYFRGIGEFHIYGEAAARPLVKKAVEFAAERHLYILAHCDEVALAILLGHHPAAKIIWAHTGFSTPVTRVRELFEQHPALMGELSYRSGKRPSFGRMARAVRKPLRSLLARLRHLDQRALVCLRHHHQGLSRLVGSTPRRSGKAPRARQRRASVRR